MRLSEEQIAEIGLTAARRIMGTSRVSDARALSGEDSSGEPAVFLEFLIDRDANRGKIAVLRTKLSQAIRDELIKADEQKYPFVRLLDESDWQKLAR